jgi:DNA-binding CsgD family transcriptional regulator
MRKSRRLRVGEVRAVGRLVGECRELGDRLPEWRRHLNVGLGRLLGAAIVVAGEFRPPGEPGTAFRTIDGTLDHLGGNSYAAWRAWVDQAAPTDHPAGVRLALDHGPGHTKSRRQVLADDGWYRSAAYQGLYRPHGVDDGVYSLFPLAGSGGFTVNPCRLATDRPFGGREVKLLHLTQLELAPHLGRSLATALDPATRLSRRLRQVLDRLLDGDGEKQAAARLGVSAATVREYVQAVYRQFGVSSRAELLAHFLRRHRRPAE